MKPYYEDDLVTLYHGDCREVMAWLEADVLICDVVAMTLADEIRAWTRADKRARDAYYEGPRTAINVRCECGQYTQARSGVCQECRKEMR